MMKDHWLHGFHYNVEELDADGLHHVTLAICRQLAYARTVFKEAIAVKPAGRGSRGSRSRSRPNARLQGPFCRLEPHPHRLPVAWRSNSVDAASGGLSCRKNPAS
jgi:hypothetical protein